MANISVTSSMPSVSEFIMLDSSINSAGFAFFPEIDTGVAVMAFLGKIFATAAFNVMYIYTAELFPTEVRHIGFGICSSVGRISGIASTFIGAELVSFS